MRTWIGALLILTASCAREEVTFEAGKSTALPLLGEGTYQGIFFRASSTMLPKPFAVTLQLNGGSFSGVSDGHLPVICKGAYTISGGTITFTNDCDPESMVNPSVLLQGDFELQVDDTEWVLTKYHGGGIRDIYRLRRSAAL